MHLNGYLGSLFSPWCGPNHASAEYALSVAQQQNCLYRLDTPDESLSGLSAGQLFLHLEYTLTTLFQRLYRRNLLIHGACVARNGEGALFTGDHGIGKTTLALTAISSGMQALTDDVAILTDDLSRVIGFPRPFKVTADTWRMHPRVVPQDTPSIPCTEDVTYVCFYKPHGRYYAKQANLRMVIFPVRHDGKLKWRRLGETEALRRLLPQGFNFYQRGDTLIGEILELLRIAPPYELLYRDHWEAIGQVKALL